MRTIAKIIFGIFLIYVALFAMMIITSMSTMFMLG